MISLLLAVVLALPSPLENAVRNLAAFQIFKTTQYGIWACSRLSQETGMAIDVCARLLKRESYGGDPDAMRFCKKWEKTKPNPDNPDDPDWWCPSGYWTSREGWSKSNAYILAHASEVSEWQLRTSPTWSWVRYANKVLGKKWTILDMRDHDKSRAAMREAYRHLLSEVAEKGSPCPNSGTEIEVEMAWLGYWNGCNSYNAHLIAVRAFREGKQVPDD